MKNNWRTGVSLLAIGVLLISVVAVFIEARYQTLQRLYDTFVLDNRNHYLSCNELPTKMEAERIVKEHQDVIQQIQQVAPGFVSVEIDTSTCEGRADLLISYGTHQQRVDIEKIIGSDTFFGIPYRLQNR